MFIGLLGTSIVLRILFVQSIRKTNAEDVDLQVQQKLPTPYNVGNIAKEIRVQTTESKNTSRVGFDIEQLLQDTDFAALDHKTADQRGFAVAGFEAAGLFGSEIIHKFLMVDDYVYEGIGRLAGQQFDSFADLSARVQTYEQDFFGGLTEGSLRKVGGHIAEPYVADHFASAGLDVQWPDASNQAGWDLLIEGHEVNVKLVADAEHLAKHFRDYPDIPAVVPGDMANIPENAIHWDPSAGVDELFNIFSSGQEKLILVDDALSHADVMDQTADATDALVGSSDLVSSHMPWVTLALSGWREAKLLQSGKTDFLSATKNASLDVAGTGIGGGVGALKSTQVYKL